jgi:hypothetical protein
MAKGIFGEGPEALATALFLVVVAFVAFVYMEDDFKK